MCPRSASPPATRSSRCVILRAPPGRSCENAGRTLSRRRFANVSAPCRPRRRGRRTAGRRRPSVGREATDSSRRPRASPCGLVAHSLAHGAGHQRLAARRRHRVHQRDQDGSYSESRNRCSTRRPSVSPEVAEAMAVGARRSGLELTSVSTTGFAGPGAGGAGQAGGSGVCGIGVGRRDGVVSLQLVGNARRGAATHGPTGRSIQTLRNCSHRLRQGRPASTLSRPASRCRNPTLVAVCDSPARALARRLRRAATRAARAYTGVRHPVAAACRSTSSCCIRHAAPAARRAGARRRRVRAFTPWSRSPSPPRLADRDASCSPPRGKEPAPRSASSASAGCTSRCAA